MLALRLELFTAGSGQTIKLRSAIIIGWSPDSGDETARFEAMERRVKSAGGYGQHVAGQQLDTLHDVPAVEAAGTEQSQDSEFECALFEQVTLLFVHVFL